MNALYRSTIALPFGKLGITNHADYILSLDFLPHHSPEHDPEDDLGKELARQLVQWCRDPRFEFSLSCQAQGTLFQHSVWNEISAIPVGETRTYAELAQRLNSSPRAVGNACGRNPLPIIVPCHRVVSRSGLGGFNQSRTDWLLEIKRWLLQHELSYSTTAFTLNEQTSTKMKR